MFAKFFSVLIIIYLTVLVLNPSFAQKKGDAKTDSIRVQLLIDEGNKLKFNLDKKAPSYFLRALEIANTQKQPNQIQQVQALKELGIYYAYKGTQDSAKYFYGLLMKNGIDNKNQLTIAKANIGLGIVADYQADYETAINKNLLALKYAESVNDSSGIAASSGNIANSYIRLKQFNKAIPLLNTAIYIYNKQGLKIPAANNISSLARAYKGIGDKKTEIMLKLKALSMFTAQNYKKGIATVSINLGVYYNDLNNINEAKKYFYLALNNSRAINEKSNIAILYNNMSDMYLGIKALDSAKICCDSAYYYASKNGDRLSRYDALLNQSKIDFALGKNDQALKKLDLYINLKDSVYNDKMQHQVADMNIKYETEKKEARIALLNKENNIKTLLLKNNQLEIERNKDLITQQQQDLTIGQLALQNKNQLVKNQQLDAEKKAQNIKSLKKQSKIQALEIKNRVLEVKKRNQFIGLISILFVTIAIIAYSFYNRYSLKQKNILQAEIFKQHEISTQSLFEGEQNERIRIARDLHDSIGQMLAIVKMNVSSMDNIETQNSLVNKTASLIDKTIEEVRHISHNLIPEELNFGLFNALESLCDKINTSKKTIATLNVTEDLKAYKFEKQNELSIYRIVQEVLNNMVKHANATEIGINVLSRDNLMIIYIKDNGKGFDPNDIKQSNGLGWKNIAARVNMLNGNLQVLSEILSGTEIEISIPEWIKKETA